MPHNVDIRVLQAKGLKEVVKLGKSQPYLSIVCDEKEVKGGKSPKAGKTLNPEFDFKVSFEVGAPIHVHVLKIRVMSGSKEMGHCELPLGQVIHLASYDQIFNHTMALETEKGAPCGEIGFKIRICSEAGAGEGAAEAASPAAAAAESTPLKAAESNASAASPFSDSPRAGPAGEPEGGSKEIDPAFRERVVMMYKVYCPEKLEAVDGLLQKTKRTDDELMAALVERYGPEPESSDEEAAPAAVPPPVVEAEKEKEKEQEKAAEAAKPEEVPAAAAAAAPVVSLQDLPPSEHLRIVRKFYKTYDPEKIGVCVGCFFFAPFFLSRVCLAFLQINPLGCVGTTHHTARRGHDQQAVQGQRREDGGVHEEEARRGTRDLRRRRRRSRRRRRTPRPRHP